MRASSGGVRPIEAVSARVRSLGRAVTLPAGFDDWFARCVDRNPARRFPDASVAMESLRRAGQCGHALAAMELQALGLA